MAVSQLAPDCRTPALSALGLPEGARLAVNYKTHQSQQLYGTLHGDNIRLQLPDRNFRDVTPLDFLRVAGYTRRVTKVYEKIHVIDANNITLADRAEGRWEKDVSQSQRIAKLLSDKWGATTLGDFEAWCKAQPLMGTAYRVLRSDEDASCGLLPKPDPQTHANRTPYRLNHFPSTPASDYLNAVNDHIFNGNKPSCKQPFISATMQLKTALSYSYYGCHDIVEIDLAKCAAAGVLALDMGDSLNSLCWGGQPQHFAFASREVVLCGEVPADCVKLLKIEWKPLSCTLSDARPNAHRNKLFPKQLVLDNIKVKKVLEEGFSKPLRITVTREQAAESDQESQQPETEPKPKRRRVQALGQREFVLKRCGGNGPGATSAHIASEFCALAIYDRAGAAVPRAALYSIKVTVGTLEMPVKLMLTEWIGGGMKLDADILLEIVGGQRQHLKQELQATLAVDVALSNFDVAGPAFNNLLLAKKVDGKETIYRLDLGGCGFFNPRGKYKPADQFDSTSKAALEKAFAAMSGGGKVTFDAAPGVSALSTGPGGYKAETACALLLQGVSLKDLAQQAAALLSAEHRMTVDLSHWLSSQAKGMSDIWVDTIERLHERLRVLALLAPAPADAAEPTELAVPTELQPITVVSARAAKRKNESDCYSAKFRGTYPEADYVVMDVTSGGDTKALSPFVAHDNSYRIPIPGQPAGAFSTTVEGIWQGLKIFEGKGDGAAEVGIDRSKFSILRSSGIKRTEKRFGQCLGHAWSGDHGNEPEQRLQYVEARTKIYIPAFQWVLNNVPNVQAALRKVAEAALKKPVVLLDYYTNDDVNNIDTPLSHAALVKEYVEMHWRTLLNLPA